jgi:hypothetical protein
VAAPASAYWLLTSTPSDAVHPVGRLAAPADLAGSAQVVEHTGAVDLAWAAVPGAAAYEVRRDGVAVCSGAAATCRDTGLPTGTTAGYEVRALVGQWRGPAAQLAVPVPHDRRLLVTAPASAVVGTPFSVTVVALDGTRPDPTAVGTRTLSVSTGGTTTVALSTQADGSVSGTAQVAVDVEGTFSLTLTDTALPERTGTSGPVVVGRSGGAMAFADCTGPPGYTCGSRMRLDGTPVSAVLTRATADAAGNPLPLPEAVVTLSLSNPSQRKGVLDRVTVRFPAGATTSERFTYSPDPGANGNLQISATAVQGQTAPPPLTLFL